MRKFLLVVTGILLYTFSNLSLSMHKSNPLMIFGVDLLNLSTIADCKEPRDKQSTCITRSDGEPNVIFIGTEDVPSGIEIAFGYEPKKDFIIFVHNRCLKDKTLLNYLESKYGLPSLKKEFDGSYAYDWIKPTEVGPHAIYLTISPDGTCSSAIQIVDR